MTLLMPYLKIAFKIICYLAIIPLIGSSIAIICLYFSKDKPIDNTKKEEPTYYWWFDKGIWKE